MGSKCSGLSRKVLQGKEEEDEQQLHGFFKTPELAKKTRLLGLSCEEQIGCKLHRTWEVELIKTLHSSVRKVYDTESARFGIKKLVVMPNSASSYSAWRAHASASFSSSPFRDLLVVQTLCYWANHPIIHKLMLERRHIVEELEENTDSSSFGLNYFPYRDVSSSSSSPSHYSQRIKISILDPEGEVRHPDCILRTLLHEMAHTESPDPNNHHSDDFWKCFNSLIDAYLHYDPLPKLVKHSFQSPPITPHPSPSQ